MRQWTAFTVALALAGTAGAGLATSGEDDLAIVKKAVASPARARRVRADHDGGDRPGGPRPRAGPAP